MIVTMTRLTMVLLIVRGTVSTRVARTPLPVEHDAIHFPGPSVGGGSPLTETPDTVDLPFDLNELDVNSLNRLNTITNISEFVDLFNLALPEPPLTADGGIVIASRFGNIKDKEPKAEMANCKPELVTVPLDLPIEAQTTFFPICIRLEQCGGCCYGPHLTCRPTATKAVKVQVLKLNSDPSNRGGRRNRRNKPSTYHVVEAIKHTSCKCGCIVLEEDCNSDIHTYFEGNCSCVCKNKDEKIKCEKQNSTKYWDNKTCKCICRKPLDCGSGEFFSQNSCSCERVAA